MCRGKDDCCACRFDKCVETLCENGSMQYEPCFLAVARLFNTPSMSRKSTFISRTGWIGEIDVGYFNGRHLKQRRCFNAYMSGAIRPCACSTTSTLVVPSTELSCLRAEPQTLSRIINASAAVPSPSAPRAPQEPAFSLASVGHPGQPRPSRILQVSPRLKLFPSERLSQGPLRMA
jgi:hypothetical protein